MDVQIDRESRDILKSLMASTVSRTGYPLSPQACIGHSPDSSGIPTPLAGPLGNHREGDGGVSFNSGSGVMVLCSYSSRSDLRMLWGTVRGSHRVLVIPCHGICRRATRKRGVDGMSSILRFPTKFISRESDNFNPMPTGHRHDRSGIACKSQ